MRSSIAKPAITNQASNLIETSIRFLCTTFLGSKNKSKREYIDSNGKVAQHMNILNQSVKIPTHWERKKRNDPAIFNRTSVGSLSLHQPIKLNENSTQEEICAGVPSGYIERFELEKYNPKHLITPKKFEQNDKRPYKTKNELNMFRLQNERLTIKDKIEEWEAVNPYWVDSQYFKDEQNTTGKIGKTKQEIKQEQVKKARIQNGLDENTHFINRKKEIERNVNIPLTYNENPEIKTQAQLFEKRERKKTKDIEKFHGKVKSIREFDSKVEIKENVIYNKNCKKNKRYTRTEMIKNRKDKENEYNKQHFKLKMIGVHGQDLPTFAQTNKEWWKLRDGYKSNPKNISHCQLQQDNQFWSRNDQILLADFTGEEAPLDAFKVHFKVENKKDHISEKPNHDKCVKINKNVKRAKSNSMRWSEKEGRFKNQKCRIFDKIVPPAPKKSDYDPLFSSFNKNGIFIPPPNSKESLERQNLVEGKGYNKSIDFKAKRSSHKVSEIITDSFNGKLNLVDNDLNMFKRVQSSYGTRKSDFKLKDQYHLVDGESTKAGSHSKGKRCLSIRSGAFRL